MTRVVLAPDKFKGTLTAAEVAEHLSAGILDVRPDVEVTVVPVSDGGDGLLEAAHARGLKLVLDEVLAHTSDEHPWQVHRHRLFAPIPVAK